MSRAYVAVGGRLWSMKKEKGEGVSRGLYLKIDFLNLNTSLPNPTRSLGQQGQPFYGLHSLLQKNVTVSSES